MSIQTQKQAIIFIGAPGSGKGTQSKILSNRINFQTLVAGDLLRAEIDQQTAIGNLIYKDMSKGNLPPSELVMEVLDKNISGTNIIFDGIPRNAIQVSLLNNLLLKHKYKLVCVIMLHISHTCAINRLLNRYMCKNCNYIYSSYVDICILCKSKDIYRRNDDNIDVITNRLKINDSLCDAIISQYNQELVYHINGELDTELVASEIFQLVTLQLQKLLQ